MIKILDSLIQLVNSLFYDEIYRVNTYKYMQIKRQFRFRNIDNIFYSTNYSDEFKNMIYELKYKKRKYVAHSFAELIEKDVDYIIKKYNIDEVIAVPISKKRLKQRGFNQVELILEKLNIKSIKIKKVLDNKRMSKLKYNYEKYLNIHNSFSVDKLNIDNKNILIVDDIITTGHTIDEISKQLNKNYKNIKIYVYAIAVAKSYEIKKSRQSLEFPL